ncbi:MULTISPECIES: hypothetical protein [Vibrio]|uniref:Uncharacterized protein n=1 Tax=Vibrio zhanjiangensis TaxID=1046128 RepID=A0ABQ6EV84_9VIBR|nr:MULTISPECIES: hypothetical protein [Vibrio]HDG1715309.1 hypothetical protein [Vibrio cholerae]ASJ37593.1 hypothetical protein VVCECT4999_02330 [Vibrio vulnificus]EGR0353885.1 hypothetical protein [Vibrio vulnificus]EGR0641899.1 hypothetical protein [Vibrio vulnificus]EGR0651159.1 hypothetical protein [Vibrio vulnificus]
MDEAINWVCENFDVLFSGLGVYVVSLIVAAIVAVIGYFFFRSKASSNNVTMSNIRAGGDVVGRDKKGS